MELEKKVGDLYPKSRPFWLPAKDAELNSGTTTHRMQRNFMKCWYSGIFREIGFGGSNRNEKTEEETEARAAV